jgi:Holliday junction resolvasome RuvABC endonuclease subunit
MRTLGIDPGLHKTGWCMVLDEKTWHSDTFTRPKDDPDWLEVLVVHLLLLVKKYDPELVAIEAFTHRPYLRRRIRTAPEMGRLIGHLEANLQANGQDYITVPAEDSKAGMAFAKKWFPGPRGGTREHEWSAWCAAMTGMRLWQRRYLEA